MSKSGCTYYGEGRKPIELDTGWYKGWLVENVYGWHFLGPITKWPAYGPYVNLVVLHYEPNEQQRAEIEERFRDALAPDGSNGMEYPA